MQITSIRCSVLGAHVTVLSDLEGRVANIICPEYDGSTGTCRLKKTALEGGPLSQLLERSAEETLSTRGTECILRAA